MKRSTTNSLIAMGYLTVLMVAGYMLAGREKAGPPTVTVSAPTATPWPSDDAEAEPEVDRPLDRARAALDRRRPLSFSGPEGVLVVPAEFWWDTLDPECARKLLALAARVGAIDGPTPHDYSRYAGARFGAAWKACPGFRR